LLFSSKQVRRSLLQAGNLACNEENINEEEMSVMNHECKCETQNPRNCFKDILAISSIISHSAPEGKKLVIY